MAATKRLEHVRAAYKDPRFSPEGDRLTHFVTRNLLSAPVLDADGEVVAVVQFLNKNGGGAFTEGIARV